MVQEWLWLKFEGGRGRVPHDFKGGKILLSLDRKQVWRLNYTCIFWVG